jgi:hypothetical protein
MSAKKDRSTQASMSSEMPPIDVVVVPTSLGRFSFAVCGATHGVTEFEYRPPRSRRSFIGDFMISRTGLNQHWHVDRWTVNPSGWSWRKDYKSIEDFDRHARAASRAVPDSVANTIERAMMREVLPWLVEHESEFIFNQLRSMCEQDSAAVINEINSLVDDKECGHLDTTLQSIAARVLVIKHFGRFATSKIDQFTIEAHADLTRAHASLAALAGALQSGKHKVARVAA